MDNKIIDFNKEKAKLLKKKFPNVQKANAESKTHPAFLESNKALDKFQTILVKYQDYLYARDQAYRGDATALKGKKEIKLDEVMLYFNQYFDAVYKEMIKFDSKKIPKFKEILDYAMLSSGKRIRPFLMLVSYNFALGEDFLLIAPLMVAMEMIHTFSLIHDDLPCMDNDTLRRGKPTVWKKYGEDMAVLAGDSLMMHASLLLIEMIMEMAYTEIGVYVTTSCLILMKLAGLDGMIQGQVYDVINTTNKKLTLDDITYMYEKKTTDLLVASLVCGANLSGKLGDKIISLEKLGMMIGEAYQIKDDLLELKGTTKQIGKSNKSDKKNGKVTYVSKVGVERAEFRIEDLNMDCLELIDALTVKANVKEALVLKEVVNYIFERKK